MKLLWNTFGLPVARLLTFFHQSMFVALLDTPNVQDRQKQLSQHHWALLSAFWNGALNAAAPGVRIIDGADAAIRSARAKIAKGQSLGFGIADFIAAGNLKMTEAEKANKPPQEEKKKKK